MPPLQLAFEVRTAVPCASDNPTDTSLFYDLHQSCASAVPMLGKSRWKVMAIAEVVLCMFVWLLKVYEVDLIAHNDIPPVWVYPW